MIKTPGTSNVLFSRLVNMTKSKPRSRYKYTYPSIPPLTATMSFVKNADNLSGVITNKEKTNDNPSEEISQTPDPDRYRLSIDNPLAIFENPEFHENELPLLQNISGSESKSDHHQTWKRFTKWCRLIKRQLFGLRGRVKPIQDPVSSETSDIN